MAYVGHGGRCAVAETRNEARVRRQRGAWLGRSEAPVMAAVAEWINTGKAPEYINQEKTQ